MDDTIGFFVANDFLKDFFTQSPENTDIILFWYEHKI